MSDRYIQIDKGNCAGHKSLFEDIIKDLRKTGKYNVIENEIVLTIREKKVEEKPKKKK